MFYKLPIALAVLAVAAAFIARERVTAQSVPPVHCADEETKAKVRAIMTDAMDTALKNHIVRLHEVWMRDGSGQPARAVNGVRQGIYAYIAGRKRALNWDMPACT